MKGGFRHFMRILINKCLKVHVYLNLRHSCDNSFIVWSKTKTISIRPYIGPIFLFSYHHIIVKFNIFLHKTNMLIITTIMTWLNIVHFIMCLHVWRKSNAPILAISENMQKNPVNFSLKIYLQIAFGRISYIVDTVLLFLVLK